MTYEQAKKQARANADYFHRPYYVTSTSMGFEVTRDKPDNESRIYFTAQPVSPESAKAIAEAAVQFDDVLKRLADK